MFAVETIMLLDYVIIYLYKEYKNVLMARGLGVRERGGGVVVNNPTSIFSRWGGGSL